MRSAGIEVQFLKRNPTGYVSLLEQKKDCGVAVPQPFWCVVNNQCNLTNFSIHVFHNERWWHVAREIFSGFISDKFYIQFYRARLGRAKVKVNS